MPLRLSPFAHFSSAAVKDVVSRYWLSLLSGVLAAGCFIHYIELEDVLYTDAPFWWVRLGCTLVLLLLMFAAVQLRSSSTPLFTYGTVLLAGAAMYLLLPTAPTPTFLYRYGLLLLVSGLLIPTVLPSAADYWLRVYRLVSSVVIAILYGAFLFLALVLALASVDTLFAFDIPSQRFAQLWLLDILVVIPFLSLSLLHQHTRSTADAYPNVLRLFALYVVVPVAVLYLLILYAYGVKILLQGEWPNGWVAAPVLGLSGFGILYYAFTEPLPPQELPLTARAFRRGFWWALLPLLALMFASIWIRISAYGLTEERLLIVFLGLWLLLLALVSLREPMPGLRKMLLSLCSISLLAALSITPLSVWSQSSRFNAIMAASGQQAPFTALAEGQFSLKQLQQLSATALYLSSRQQLQALEEVAPAAAGTDAADSLGEYERARSFMARLGLRYVDQWELENRGVQHFWLSAASSSPLDISGYSQLLQIDTNEALRQTATEMRNSSLGYTAQLVPPASILITTQGRQLKFSLDSLLQQQVALNKFDNELPAEELTFMADNQHTAKLVIHQLEATREADSLMLDYISGFLLIK